MPATAIEIAWVQARSAMVYSGDGVPAPMGPSGDQVVATSRAPQIPPLRVPGHHHRRAIAAHQAGPLSCRERIQVRRVVAVDRVAVARYRRPLQLVVHRVSSAKHNTGQRPLAVVTGATGDLDDGLDTAGEGQRREPLGLDPRSEVPQSSVSLPQQVVGRGGLPSDPGSPERITRRQVAGMSKLELTATSFCRTNDPGAARSPFSPQPGHVAPSNSPSAARMVNSKHPA
jgi:hypothetical protein